MRKQNKLIGNARTASAAGKASANARRLRAGTGIVSHAIVPNLDYSDQELEFLRAVNAWQQTSGVRFPTACDYRAILLSLGYAQVSRRTA